MSERQHFTFRLRNSHKSTLIVYLEPWGEAHRLDPGEQLQVEANGPTGGGIQHTLEIQSDENSITLWGWSGSGVTVNPI